MNESRTAIVLQVFLSFREQEFQFGNRFEVFGASCCTLEFD